MNGTRLRGLRGWIGAAATAGLLCWVVFGWLVPGFTAPEGIRASVAAVAADAVPSVPTAADAAATVTVTPATPAPAADQSAAGAGSSLASTGETALLTGNAALVDADWAARVAAATGIPRRAMLGYAGASLALAAEQPGCRLGWSTLAGLGNIESGHGTHAGSALGTDGTARPGIFGPALDGSDFAAMSDTDGGAWDGSAAWDRAVGPLQFIPATWQRWGADGNRDGVDDPQQIDDAALAAGRYLCNYGDLALPDRWRAAVFAYNHVDSYVTAVAGYANTYAARAK
ncbi:lytic transglycosylase domain-containing protein [Cryobacterium sp. 10S3]|uniref:lytic transglycosylase domain-containing protein n=1 Tax=unclassified Cryobacterium TaxID=2649013 RepID=UPI002B224583|nr:MULTISPECIES: lytic transglycosylase domain-containing protein [unclassified Cryobacterium]MEB0003469.1 lytic transglycosylase domain-containing protein [Cryobacterium sp. RTC2.1]MEB0286554.1 lytic transglycosylase domain-containing protein [Cryobacterium sp. 10S3]